MGSPELSCTYFDGRIEEGLPSNKCSHITKLWDIVENESRPQDLQNKSISNSESVRSTSLKSTVDHDVLYKEFEAFMKPQRDSNNKTKSQGRTLLRGRS